LLKLKHSLSLVEWMVAGVCTGIRFSN